MLPMRRFGGLWLVRSSATNHRTGRPEFSMIVSVALVSCRSPLGAVELFNARKACASVTRNGQREWWLND